MVKPGILADYEDTLKQLWRLAAESGLKTNATGNGIFISKFQRYQIYALVPALPHLLVCNATLSRELGDFTVKDGKTAKLVEKGGGSRLFRHLHRIDRLPVFQVIRRHG